MQDVSRQQSRKPNDIALVARTTRQGLRSKSNNAGATKEGHIEKLGNKELEERFEALLAESNLSKEKKLPLRGLPTFKKRNLLLAHAKGNTLDALVGAREPPITASAVHEGVVKSFDDQELDDKFEMVLVNCNLDDETKLNLRENPVAGQRDTFTLLKEPCGAFATAGDYVAFLSQPDLTVNKTLGCVESLHIALTNSTNNWVQEFGAEGLAMVLNLLNECYARNDLRYDRIQHACLQCISALINNTVGAKQVFCQRETLAVIARSLDPSKEAVMLETLRVLVPVCLVVHPNGHTRVINALSEASTMRNNRRDTDTSERFGALVQGLLNCQNEPLQVASMTLINALVIIPEDVDTRQSLHDEVLRTGLGDMIENLEKVAPQELAHQLSFFGGHKDERRLVFVSWLANSRRP